MLTFIQKRLGSERGFTLIELLVVMIIISILMAVAVPVFLSQKQKAIASNAKQTAKHVQNTVEACAAGTTTGQIYQAAPTGVTGALAVNCSLNTTLIEEEPSLKQSLDLSASCGGQACVRFTTVAAQGRPDDYTFYSRTNTTDAQGAVNFVVERTQNGVVKRCATTTPSTDAGKKAEKRMCPQRTW